MKSVSEHHRGARFVGDRWWAGVPTPPRRQVTRAVALLLLVLGGCHGHSAVEPEHHTPAHKPVDLIRAVERLTDLRREIVDGPPRAETALDVWTELTDVVRWLPELAADSDLNEAAWNQVDHAARRLEGVLNDLRTRDAAARVSAWHGQNEIVEAEIRSLTQLAEVVRAASQSSVAER